MHTPEQPDSANQPPQMTERRRPAEPGSLSQPGFQPKRRDEADKDAPQQQLLGALPSAPGDGLPLDVTRG